MNLKQLLVFMGLVDQRRRLYTDIFDIIELAKKDTKSARDRLAKNKNIDIFKFVSICEENKSLTPRQVRTLLLGA